MIAAPGLVDAHMHVDTTFLVPSELARILVPLGTTALCVDTTNVAHTGFDSIPALRDAFHALPLKAYFVAPSYCPFDASLETAAEELTADTIERLLSMGCIGIGETVWSRIALNDTDYLAAIQHCRTRGLRVSGHGGELPRGEESAFDAYAAVGVQDDHCLSQGADILPRLRRGMKLFAVEASGRRGQLRRLLSFCVAHKLPLRHVCLCVDNITLMDMVPGGYGYLDYLVRIALECGVAPVDVFRMVTLNPAEHYRIADEVGSLAPGRAADILLLKEPGAFPPAKVLVNGKVVAEEGRLLATPAPHNFPESCRQSIHLEGVTLDSFVIEAERADGQVTVRVIDVIDGDAFNSASTADLPVVRGFGLVNGAMATSLSIPSNHIVVVGCSDEAMLTAVEHLRSIQGGFVLANAGQVIADVPLAIGGIMSDEPYEVVVEKVQTAQALAAGMGCPLLHPFFTMAQTVLCTLPDLGLTDRGLVDARQGKILPVLVEGAR